MNLAAFAWGRRAAVDEQAVRAVIGAKVEKKPETLDEIIARRADFLTAYQDAAYAESYRGFVARVRAVSEPLAFAVAQNLFRVFKNSRLKGKFRELIEKVIDKKGAKKMWEEIGNLNFIQIEGRLNVPGTQHLPDLIQHIYDRSRISFRYEKDGKKRTVSPYFLQQNNEHWYLIAYDHDKKGDEALRVYALDKISNIAPVSGGYYKDPTFRPDEFFKHSLGIWHRHDLKPVKLVLEILDKGWHDRLQLHPARGVRPVAIRGIRTQEIRRRRPLPRFGAPLPVAETRP
jgi:hypothetical protein